MQERRPRYPREFRIIVGKLLYEEERVRGRVKQMSKATKVTTRTLENWVKIYKTGGNAKVGRPSYSRSQRRRAMWMVGRVFFRYGYRSWRGAKEMLPDVPTRLVQGYIKLFKARERKQIDERRKSNRQNTDVIMKNAYWVQDGTHVGRIERKSIEAQVIKDRGTLQTLAIKTGKAATAKDVTTIFKEVKKERGLPLVIGTDNGSCYCNKEVQDYLREEKVVHLLSLPRTPQHNAAAEIAIRELKEGTVLGKGVALDDTLGPHALLVRSAQRLNARLRGSKKLKSANELDDKLTDATKIIDRAVFYEECQQGILMISSVIKDARERRMLEREVILGVLEKHGAIKRTRGERNYGEKCEVLL